MGIKNMSKVNTDNVASEEECKRMREYFIEKGQVKVNKKEEHDVIEKDVVITRDQLIGMGIVSGELCKLAPDDRKLFRKDSGEYVPTPITNEKDYERKRRIYFRMMQEILISREELELNMGDKPEGAPKWHFQKGLANGPDMEQWWWKLSI